MGHAIHFLERLKRIDDGHIEQVLSLYYSSKRTKMVIDLALDDLLAEEDRLAVETERVALALDDTDAPPYLIATRAGQMVTCLAPGMLPYGLRVVSGSALERACCRYDDMKSRTDDYLKLKQQEGSKKHGNIFNPIFDDGWALPRSTMRGLSFLHPWLELDAFRRAISMASALDLSRDNLVKLVRRAQVSHDTQRWVKVDAHSKMKSRLQQRYDEPLRKYWERAWAMTHLMMLSVCEGSSQIQTLMSSDQVLDYARAHGTSFDPRLIAWSAIRQGSLPMALRGIWVNAQLGDTFLDGVEHCLGKHISPLGILNHLMPTGMLALRETSTGARARALLEKAATNEPLSGEGSKPYYQAMAKFLYEFAEKRDAAHLLDSGLERQGRIYYNTLVGYTHDTKTAIPCPAADLPSDVAMTIGTLAPLSSHAPTQYAYDHIAFHLPWLSRAKADDFYVPDAFAPLLRIWNPAMCADMLLGHAATSHNQFATKPSAPKIGRNDPCSCGSGKKYKTCCLLKTP